MPEFTLDCGNIEGRLSFDTLPAIVRGYIEAALFTGIARCSDSDEIEEIPGLAVEDLTPKSLDWMASDALRFWVENRQDLAAAIAAMPEYNLAQAGRDLWFTRNGHGVGFWDRGLGDIGERLSASAMNLGECELFAEAVAGGGWRVHLAYPETIPLTEAERTTLAAMFRESP